ncbi:MAG TPA: BON domain-containing protein [Bacillota bacterium]|nr:BON domain-containing protein [Bacillota bacterium]HOL08920.1 BON domain-containing protein [Bacillota bacterium]HPO96613.1 BON domain-containing protein [Bacillota bacterium]
MRKISAEELSERINNKLLEDQNLAPYALKAKVYEDGSVRIQGIVDVLEEKQKAEELVSGFPGVKRVENDITVCTDGPIDDGDVAFEVSEELLANPGIPDTIGVKVYGGEAQLIGNASSVGEIDAAVEAASKARGVTEVTTQIKVAEDIDDASITNQIQTVLINELDLTPGKVRITTTDGEVILSGSVTKEQALRAMQLVAKIPGVKRVISHLDDDQIVGKTVPYLQYY